MERIRIYPSSQNEAVEDELFSIEDSGVQVEITIKDYDAMEKQDIARANFDSNVLTIYNSTMFWDGILDGFDS